MAEPRSTHSTHSLYSSALNPLAPYPLSIAVGQNGRQPSPSTLTGFLTIIWQQFILCENFVKLPPKIFMESRDRRSLPLCPRRQLEFYCHLAYFNEALKPQFTPSPPLKHTLVIYEQLNIYRVWVAGCVWLCRPNVWLRLPFLTLDYFKCQRPSSPPLHLTLPVNICFWLN